MKHAIVLLTLACAAPLHAQATRDSTRHEVQVTEEQPGLLARASVRPDSAVAVARRRVPHGVIRTAVIEEEDGLLVYSFEFAVPDVSGVTEVNVDARTGKVVSVEREGA